MRRRPVVTLIEPPPDLTRLLGARKLAAARLATNLIVDCEWAVSGRNGKRADPARWTETDWRPTFALPRDPWAASGSLAPSYRAIGDIGPPLAPIDAQSQPPRSLLVASNPNS